MIISSINVKYSESKNLFTIRNVVVSASYLKYVSKPLLRGWILECVSLTVDFYWQWKVYDDSWNPIEYSS